VRRMPGGQERVRRENGIEESGEGGGRKKSKRWAWRLLGGGKAVGLSATSGKRWVDR
jgi:hypothetical protein